MTLYQLFEHLSPQKRRNAVARLLTDGGVRLVKVYVRSDTFLEFDARDEALLHTLIAGLDRGHKLTGRPHLRRVRICWVDREETEHNAGADGPWTAPAEMAARVVAS